MLLAATLSEPKVWAHMSGASGAFHMLPNLPPGHSVAVYHQDIPGGRRDDGDISMIISRNLVRIKVLGTKNMYRTVRFVARSPYTIHPLFFLRRVLPPQPAFVSFTRVSL